MLVLACVSIDQSPSQSPPPRPNNDTGAGWGGNHTSGNKQQLELFTPVGLGHTSEWALFITIRLIQIIIGALDMQSIQTC